MDKAKKKKNYSLLKRKRSSLTPHLRGLISKINTELKKVDIEIQNYRIKKWGTELNRFSWEESQMLKRYLRNCSTYLVIREMQIKMTPRCHPMPVRMPKIKNTEDSLC